MSLAPRTGVALFAFPPPLITKKVRGHWLACLRKPCFQTFRKEVGEGGDVLLKKQKNPKENHQSIWKGKKKKKKKKKYLLTIKLLYINPNILSTATNILVQQQDLR